MVRRDAVADAPLQARDVHLRPVYCRARERAPEEAGAGSEGGSEAEGGQMSTRPTRWSLSYWTPARRQAFAEAWNAGVTMEALRERFGIKKPDDIARRMRQQGVELARRRKVRQEA